MRKHLLTLASAALLGAPASVVTIDWVTVGALYRQQSFFELRARQTRSRPPSRGISTVHLRREGEPI